MRPSIKRAFAIVIPGSLATAIFYSCGMMIMTAVAAALVVAGLFVGCLSYLNGD